MPIQFAKFLSITLILQCFACTNIDEPVLDGYTDQLSYLPGDTVLLFANGAKTISDYKFELNTWNGYNKASVVADLNPQLANGAQPWADGMNYDKTAEFVIPKGFKSGIYRWNNAIPFVVREPKPSAKILVVLEVNTLNAYSRAGGKSLYASEIDHDPEDAHEVSFQRPMSVHKYSAAFWSWCEVMTQKYDIAYITDLELEDFNVMEKAKILVIPGHSEYWTRKARTNFDRFVDQGGHAMILSGNTMWWQVRYNDDRTSMICYKSHREDPEPDSTLKTHNYDWPGIGYSVTGSTGLEFAYGGYGDQHESGFGGFKILSPGSPFLFGTGLKEGDTLQCFTSEYDGPPVKALDPSGIPILDTDRLSFYRYELIGFDYARRDADGIGGFVVCQRSPEAGIVMNVGTTNWCERKAFDGPSGFDIKLITLNAFNLLLSESEVFTENEVMQY